MDGLVPLPPGHKSREPSEIIRDTRKKVRERPDEPGGHFYLGCALFHLRSDVEGAISEFEKTVECDGNFVEGYKALAYCLIERKDDVRVEKILRKALRIAPKETDLLITYADLLERTGAGQQASNLSKAKKLLTKALKVETNPKIMKIVKDRLKRIEGVIDRKKFTEVWTMARKDWCRSSFVELDESEGKVSISHQGNFSFDIPINKAFLPDIPCPIVAEDMVVFPDGSMKSFRGAKVSSVNEITWRPGILVDRLTFASTPAYISPYLFFFVGRSIKCVNPNSPKPSIKNVISNPKVQMSPYCAPMAYEGTVIFAFKDCICCYDLDEEKGDFILLGIADAHDMLRSPVICDGELVVLSRAGRLYIVDIFAGSVIKELSMPIQGIHSAPCVVENNVYFEIFDEEHNTRKIAAYCPADGSILMEDLENESCDSEDVHLNFSPLVFRDSVLVSSDVSLVFYRICRIGSSLEITPLELDIQVGHQKIVSVSHAFSSVLSSYLLSKSEQGFFYVNLDDLSSNGIENLISEMITQPVIADKGKVFFLCRQGIECCLFQKEIAQEEIR